MEAKRIEISALLCMGHKKSEVAYATKGKSDNSASSLRSFEE